jgi:hypothetical protein
MTEEIIIDGVNVSEWTDEEIRYNFEKHSPKAIRQIAFDLYKQLKRADKMHKEETFDCVHRYRKILSSSPLQGLVLSETEDICIPQNVSIPNKKGCSKQCKIYASRFIKGEKNV